MKKKTKKDNIKNKTNHLFIFLLGIILVLILPMSKPIITPYAIKEDNYSINLITEIPGSHKTIHAGEELWFTLRILNLANQDRIDVTIKYEILNPEKKVIAAKSETVAIETQASFVRHLEIPQDSNAGNYFLYSIVTYANGKEAFSEDRFKIINTGRDKENNISIIISLIIFLLIVISIIIYIIIKSKPYLEEIKLKSEIHRIVKNKHLT